MTSCLDRDRVERWIVAGVVPIPASAEQEDQQLQDGDDAGTEEQSQITAQSPWIQTFQTHF